MESWVGNILPRLAATNWTCTCIGERCKSPNVNARCTRDVTKNPEQAMFFIQGYTETHSCVAFPVLLIIIEELIQLEEDVPCGFNMVTFFHDILLPSVQKDDSWHPHLLRLLLSKNTDVLYMALGVTWRVVYDTDQNLTGTGLKLLQQPFQAHLIRLLHHEKEQIVMSAIGVIVAFLRVIDSDYTMTYIHQGIMDPLRSLLHLYPSLLGEKSHQLIGWLGSTSAEARISIEELGIVKDLLRIGRKNPANGIPFGLSWFLSTPESRRLFVEEGGNDIVVKHFENPLTITRTDAFIVRKLCVDPKERQFFQQTVLPVELLAWYRRTDPRDPSNTLFAITFALIWLHLDTLSQNKDAEDCLRDSLSTMDLYQPRNIQYTKMNEQGTLLQSAHPLIQEAGLWWLLHLLTGQANGHYKRVSYDCLMVDEGLLARIQWLMKQGQVYAVCILRHLCRSTYRVRQALIEHGVLYDVMQMIAVDMTPNLLEIALSLIENDHCMTSTRVPSLDRLCELTLIDAVDGDNVLDLLELSKDMRLYWLHAMCLKYISRMESRPLDLHWLQRDDHCTGFNLVD